MADPVNFTRPAAERIAKAVRVVEFGNRDASGPVIDRPWYSDGGGAKSTFRMCTFTGTWTKGTAHVVTLYNVTHTPNTLTATNIFVDVQSGNISATSITAACAIARYAGTWYLIAAECA